MREIRLYGSEGGGAVRSPLPLSYGAPAGRQDSSPGCRQRQELGTAVPTGGTLGHQSHYLFPLPQHASCVGGEGSCEKMPFAA